MQKILITDSLFIFPEHELQLQKAGYEIVRLDKPDASEDELCEMVKDKVGYILGGIEKVTDRVIEAADSLRVIVFTGSSYKSFIPGWQKAQEKGIQIGNVPHGPTQAVAEWSIAASLAMNRGFFELASPEGREFLTTPGLQGQTVGIVGLGHIGARIAEMLQPFAPANIFYASTHRHQDSEATLNLKYVELDVLLGQSDVVFLCVPDEAGPNFLNAGHFTKMKQDALLVSFMHPGIIDPNALYDILDKGKIRAVSDYPFDERFNKFPKSTFYCFKASNAFNTRASLKHVSDVATQALINLLSI